MKDTFLVLLTIFGFIFSLEQTVFSFQSTSHENGSLVSKDVYTFPSYEQAVEKTDAEKYSSKEEYGKAVADKNFEFSKLKYVSDGLKVIAYLYKPKTVNTKLPVIIFNRGSFVRGDIAPELVTLFHRLASEGFVLVAPMYRQSDGGEGRDEVGGGDVNDLMNVLPLIKSFDFADTNNLFMYGESRGGVMTYLAIRRKFPVNAAAVFGAFTNMEEVFKDNAKVYTPTFLNQI
jgi:dipeptidyl aminopeptidase/acylaminoacyl peptidase